MSTSEEMFREARTLSPEVRAELAERVIGSLAEGFLAGDCFRYLTEVKRRINEVESGEVELIPGDEVFARARRLLA